MNKSTQENFQPEQKLNNGQKMMDSTSAPANGNTNVSGCTVHYKESAKRIYKEYKPNFNYVQKTLKNMFILGAEAGILRCGGKRSINNNPTGKPFCCDINCNNDATWEIRFSNELEDYTQSCDCHLISSIGGSEEVTVSRLVV